MVATMPDQSLKAQFFVVRPNNNMVPLVALDELPNHIHIRNVPRILSPHEIQGMISVGSFGSRHLHHSVVDMNKTMLPAQPDVAPSDHTIPLRALSANLVKPDHEVRPSSAIDPKASKPLIKIENQEDVAPLNTAIIAAAEAAGVAMLPPKSKKLYCTHWMRTGECDFTAPGCKFKHIMPFDLPTLNSHGFSDIPKWYRDKHSLGSHHAVKGAGASFDDTSFASRAATGKHERNEKQSRNWRTSQPRYDSPPSVGESYQTPSRGPRTGRRLVPETRSALHRSKHAPTTVTFPLIPSATESKLTGSPSSGETAAGVLVKQPSVASTRRGRRQHTTVALSECSDFEAEILRADAERRARLDAEYAAIKSGSDPSSSS